MKNIGIITALEKESSQLEQILGKPLKTDLYGHFFVKTYHSNGKNIYMVNSGVGQILASAATQLIIELYKVDLVINYGFAGANSTFKIGDTAVITGVCHFEFDTSAVDNCKPAHYTDLFDSQIIATNKLMQDFCLNHIVGSKPAILASGDKFVCDNNVKKQLFDSYGATVYDMEGAAITIITRLNNIPQILIKVISDSGDSSEYCNFVELVKKTQIDFANFVQQILNNL